MAREPAAAHPAIKQAEADRYFTAQAHPDDTKYICPADDLERHRLDMQHRLITSLFGNVIIPNSVELKSGDKILDSATGTGIWAIAAAASVPDGVQVYAIDIESRQWPVLRPDNTIFSVHSATSLPDAWSSTFAFVHQRFLIAALDLPNLRKTLTQILRVLKPGGVVRLVEPLNVWWHLANATESERSTKTPHTQRLVELVQSLFASRNLLEDCGARLRPLLEEAGFEAIERDERNITFGPGDRGAEWKEDVLMGCKGMKGPILKAGGFGLVHSEEEFDELMRNCAIEWGENEIKMDFVALTARKPVNLGA